MTIANTLENTIYTIYTFAPIVIYIVSAAGCLAASTVSDCTVTGPICRTEHGVLAV